MTAISVVIEWENALLSEQSRPVRMLRSLSKQSLELRKRGENNCQDPFWAQFAKKGEVIVTYNSLEIDKEKIRLIVEQHLPQSGGFSSVKLVPAPGQDYYQMKNKGAEQASGKFILFLDSDVVPQDDWLTQMVGSLKNSEVQVVGGNAFIDPYSLYAKAFALFWFFPLRQEKGILIESSTFFANNVLFRSELIKKFPFPKIEGTSRGSCKLLASQLKQFNIQIFKNPMAQVSHPPPNGIQHFVVRGLAEGRDNYLNLLVQGDYNQAVLWYSLKLFVKKTNHMRNQIRRRCRHLGIKWIGMIGCFAIALTYRLFFLLGNLGVRIFPGYMKRHFHL